MLSPATPVRHDPPRRPAWLCCCDDEEVAVGETEVSDILSADDVTDPYTGE